MNTIKSSFPLLALVLFLSMATGKAESDPHLPTRQATVVLSLLGHFSPVDTSKGSVMHELNRMLGKYDRDDEAGPDDHAWRIYSYGLDDGTLILVEFKEHSGPHSLDLAMITAQSRDGTLRNLYHLPERK